MQRIFHAVCAALLAASVWLVMKAPSPHRDAFDPRLHLERFLTASGLEIVGTRRLIGNEFIVDVKASSCDRPVQVLLLPTIHRISDEAWSILQHHPGAVLIHAGEIIPSLSPTIMIPRWMFRRALVNLQLREEDPWISIALAVLTNPNCILAPLQWNNLPQS